MKKVVGLSDNQNFAQHTVLRELNNLALFKASYTTYSYKPHFHETYTVIVIIEGTGDYSHEKNKFVTSKGSFLILNPFEVHTGRSVGEVPLNYRSMYIPKEIFYKINQKFNEDHLPVFNNKIIENNRVASMILDVHYQLYHTKDVLASEYILCDLLKKIMDVGSVKVEFQNGNYFQPLAARRLKEFIHEHYQENISLEHLSHASGLSPDHVVKVFRKKYGLPPHQYLLNLRIEKAKDLLADRMPVTDVAYQTGFFDQSHFIRNFKKIIGVTPKKYAQ